MASRFRSKYIGDKAFYSMVLAIALPIMIQNGFTNFVNMLDNVMVGRLGTEQMSGVSIANQLVFVFNLCIFGCMSGAGIYGAQYFGSQNDEGVRNTVRYKTIIGTGLVIAASLIFCLGGRTLISLFLSGSADGGDLELTMDYAIRYLRVMVIGLPGFMVTQAFASTLREGGETVLPMKAGIAAITTNLVLNWILIFGKLGCPAMGVIGAAIATVISRYVEAAIIIIGARRRGMGFMEDLFRTIRIPGKLFREISTAAAPLLMNETLWSLGMTFLVQCYSTRGLNAVAGFNIANTLNNVFTASFLAVGNTVGIVIGQLLGAGKREEAIEKDSKLIAFAIMVGAISGAVLAVVAPFFPMIYNTTDAAKHIATTLIFAMAALMPVQGFKNSTYFTLRSGGKILITFIFDSGFLWAVNVPIALLVSRLTALPVIGIYLCVWSGDIIKCIIGAYLVRKQGWAKTIVD